MRNTRRSRNRVPGKAGVVFGEESIPGFQFIPICLSCTFPVGEMRVFVLSRLWFCHFPQRPFSHWQNYRPTSFRPGVVKHELSGDLGNEMRKDMQLFNSGLGLLSRASKIPINSLCEKTL